MAEQFAISGQNPPHTWFRHPHLRQPDDAKVGTNPSPPAFERHSIIANPPQHLEPEPNDWQHYEDWAHGMHPSYFAPPADPHFWPRADLHDYYLSSHDSATEPRAHYGPHSEAYTYEEEDIAPRASKASSYRSTSSSRDGSYRPPFYTSPASSRGSSHGASRPYSYGASSFPYE